MKVIVNVGRENVVMDLKDSVCMNCANCDLEVWEKNHWDDKNWTCPDACKTMGVCGRDKIACSLFKARE